MKSALKNFPQRVWKYLSGVKLYYYLVLAIVPAMVYSHAMKFGYTGFDDEEIIAKKIDFISKVESLPQAFNRDAFMNLKGDSFYRPVGSISFMLDAILGGDNVSVFHAHNIALHILSLLLALYLFTLLGLDRRISFAVLLIFSVHPLFTHAVCWIPARMDLLLAVFTILSFITFIKFVKSDSKTAILLHHMFFVLAVFSKETALLLPVIFGLYYYLSNSGNFKKIIFNLLPGWTVIIGAYLFLREQVLQKQAAAGTFDVLAAIKNLQVIPTVLAKFLLPFGLTTMPRFQLIFVLIGLILCLGLIWLYVSKRNESREVFLFGFLWYLILSIPPALYTNPMAKFGFDYLEHRAYVPMIGIALCLSYTLTRSKSIKPSWLTGVAILAAGLSLITYTNSFNYASPLEFYSAAVRENPKCAMAYNSRSLYKFSIGDPVGAYNDLDSSLAQTSDYPPAWNNKAALFLTMKQNDSAIACLNRALALNPKYADAYVNRAIARTNLGDLPGAIRDYSESLRNDSLVDYVHYNMGNVYAYQGDFARAIQQYSCALNLNPRYLEALNNRANSHIRLSRFQDALNDCNSLIKLRPDYQRAYYNQAKAFMGLGYVTQALESVNKAIELDSSYYAAIEYRGIIIQNKGNN